MPNTSQQAAKIARLGQKAAFRKLSLMRGHLLKLAEEAGQSPFEFAYAVMLDSSQDMQDRLKCAFWLGDKLLPGLRPIDAASGDSAEKVSISISLAPPEEDAGDIAPLEVQAMRHPKPLAAPQDAKTAEMATTDKTDT